MEDAEESTMDVLTVSFEDHLVIQVAVLAELFVPSHRDPERARTEPTLELKLCSTLAGQMLCGKLAM